MNDRRGELPFALTLSYAENIGGTVLLAFPKHIAALLNIPAPLDKGFSALVLFIIVPHVLFAIVSVRQAILSALQEL